MYLSTVMTDRAAAKTACVAGIIAAAVFEEASEEKRVWTKK